MTREGRCVSNLSVEPLRADQLRQAAEWEHGPQEAADWDAYAAEMSQPQWRRFGLYVGDELVGCISLEKISRNMVAFHVATARRRIHPQALARVLFDMGGYLFRQGLVACVAHAPIEKREVARLALRCGMKEWGRTPTLRYFIMTKAWYQKQLTHRI